MTNFDTLLELAKQTTRLVFFHNDHYKFTFNYNGNDSPLEKKIYEFVAELDREGLFLFMGLKPSLCFLSTK